MDYGFLRTKALASGSLYNPAVKPTPNKPRFFASYRLARRGLPPR